MTLRHRLAVSTVVALIACTQVTDPNPGGLADPPPPGPEAPPPAPPPQPGPFPPVSGAALTYLRAAAHTDPRGALSRYVLYEDGTFALQYVNLPSVGFGEYLGRYSRVNASLTFDFDDWNSAGPWQATGSIHGDSLVVAYNLVMALANFEDGVYRLAPDDPPEPPPAPGVSMSRMRTGRTSGSWWPESSPPGRRTDGGSRSSGTGTST